MKEGRIYTDWAGEERKTVRLGYSYGADYFFQPGDLVGLPVNDQPRTPRQQARLERRQTKREARLRKQGLQI